MYEMSPPASDVSFAYCATTRPPKMMPMAPTINKITPWKTLPPVDTRMSSVLKKIPDPMTMPAIMAMDVRSPNFFVCFFMVAPLLFLLVY